MTKKLVRRAITSIYIDDSSLDDAIKLLVEQKAAWSKDYQNLRLELVQDQYSDSQSLYLIGDSIESDEEHDRRIFEEQKWAKRQEERDRAEFERLSKKFK